MYKKSKFSEEFVRELESQVRDSRNYASCAFSIQMVFSKLATFSSARATLPLSLAASAISESSLKALL